MMVFSLGSECEGLMAQGLSCRVSTVERRWSLGKSECAAIWRGGVKCEQGWAGQQGSS